MRYITVAAAFSVFAAFNTAGALPILNSAPSSARASDTSAQLLSSPSSVSTVSVLNPTGEAARASGAELLQDLHNNHHTSISGSPAMTPPSFGRGIKHDEDDQIQNRETIGNLDTKGDHDCGETATGELCERWARAARPLSTQDIPTDNYVATQLKPAGKRSTFEHTIPQPRAVKRAADAEDEIECVDTEYGHFCKGDPRLFEGDGTSIGDCKPWSWGC